MGLSQAVADVLGVGLVVTVITYATPVVGELVAKQVALRDPEAIAVKVAPAMHLLAKISLPVFVPKTSTILVMKSAKDGA